MIKKPIKVSLVLLFLLLLPFSVIKAGSINSNLENLYSLNQELYYNVKEKNFEKSKLLIEKISEIFPTIKYDKLTTVEGIEAISSAIINTKRSLAALQPNYKSIMYYTTQLYLAIDALGHKQALWHRYANVIAEDLQKILSNIKEPKEIQASINELKYHYMLIRPAILVSQQPYTVEKIDSLIIALENQVIDKNKITIINQLKESFDEVFSNADIQTVGRVLNENTIWKTSFGIGFIIFIVLSYVIWRKFKGTYFQLK